MSILGIGIDLCEVARVEKSLKRHGDAFADKILHSSERKTFENHRFQARFLAKRFAAKEAFSKALGTGIADGVTLPDIEVRNDSAGKPWLFLHAEARNKFEQLGGTKLHLSISDEKQHAIAQVIIEK